MARVNHKKLKQLLNEKRSKISDRQFFTSRILAGHFEDMAIAQTRRYKYNRRVHVNLSWKPKDGNVACTDNLTVLINAGHRIVTQNRSRMERYEIVCGLFTHELGHCLHTDFLSKQTYFNFLERNKWYPEPPRLLLLTPHARKRCGHTPRQIPKTMRCCNALRIRFGTFWRTAISKAACLRSSPECWAVAWNF